MKSKNRTALVIVAVVAVATVSVGVGLTVAGTATTVKAPALRGKGSVDEAWLPRAHPGHHIALMGNGNGVSSPAGPSTADSLGSLIVRDLTPGTGYRWDDRTTA